MSNSRDWTKDEDTRLAELWNEGFSTAAIGEKMDRTKNMVIGRSHRLHKLGLIDKRSSPIKPSNTPGRPRRPRPQAKAPTLAPVLLQPPMPSAPDSAAVAAAPAESVPSPAPAPTPRAAPARVCAFPLWGHGERPTHRYCGSPIAVRTDGTPAIYCAACYRKAHVSAWRLAA